MVSYFHVGVGYMQNCAPGNARGEVLRGKEKIWKPGGIKLLLSSAQPMENACSHQATDDAKCFITGNKIISTCQSHKVERRKRGHMGG